jgi:hypothetical protein
MTVVAIAQTRRSAGLENYDVESPLGQLRQESKCPTKHHRFSFLQPLRSH